MSSSDSAPWGRVDPDGSVYVREGDTERLVGQYPDATPEEALAYYERKFADLDGQVKLLEQRAKAGASAADVAKGVTRLDEALANAAAVGDLASLRTRLDALKTGVSELTEKQSAEAKEKLEQAVAQREALVLEAERLAASDPATTQWKQATATMERLFASWQSQQQEGPRLPKSTADALWKRFRAARSTIDQHRRAFFAELDNQHRDVRNRKTALVERAEALAPRGSEGIPAYRDLLDEWKAAGRGGRKQDDALWARFKAAGDALFQAKAEIDAQENEEFNANLTAKLALLDEAEPLLTATEAGPAREKLTGIQRRWDEIGKVPRDQMRVVTDRLRKVENAVKALEDEHWQKSNPEKKARSQGLAAQLESAIEKLQADIDAAKASGDKSKQAEAEEALAARKIWLDALG